MGVGLAAEIRQAGTPRLREAATSHTTTHAVRHVAVQEETARRRFSLRENLTIPDTRAKRGGRWLSWRQRWWSSIILVEIFWLHQNTNLSGIKENGTSDPLFGLSQDQIQLNGIYLVGDTNIKPFVQGGLGVSHFRPEGNYENETLFNFSLGGGVRADITERVRFRFDIRWESFRGLIFGVFILSGGSGGAMYRFGFRRTY